MPRGAGSTSPLYNHDIIQPGRRRWTPRSSTCVVVEDASTSAFEPLRVVFIYPLASSAPCTGSARPRSWGSPALLDTGRVSVARIRTRIAQARGVTMGSAILWGAPDSLLGARERGQRCTLGADERREALLLGMPYTDGEEPEVTVVAGQYPDEEPLTPYAGVAGSSGRALLRGRHPVPPKREAQRRSSVPLVPIRRGTSPSALCPVESTPIDHLLLTCNADSAPGHRGFDVRGHPREKRLPSSTRALQRCQSLARH